MSSRDSLQLLRKKLSVGYMGALNFDGIRVFCSHGRLLNVSTDSDDMWLLRRMLCCGWIDEEYASRLKENSSGLDLRYFPMLKQETWARLLLDRARQNLFDLSFLSTAPVEEHGLSSELQPLVELDSSKLLAHIARHRDSLHPLRTRLSQLWVQKTGDLGEHPILNSCPSVFMLSELLIQSPWEEIDMLSELQKLHGQGKLRWEESAAALSVQMTSEEQELFADNDRDHFEDHFVVEKAHLDRVVLPTPEEQTRVLSMLKEANALLKHMATWIQHRGKQPNDWLRELVKTSSAEHADFFALTEVQMDGTLSLEGSPAVENTNVALSSLLMRAARSPLAGEGRRAFVKAIDRWEQRWCS